MIKAKPLLAACAMALAGVSTLYPSGLRAQDSGYGDPAQYDSPADTASRLNDIEAQLRVLTGRVDELNHKIDQTNTDLQNMKTDTDLRFQDLNGGPNGAATPGSAGGSPHSDNGAGGPGAAPGPRNLQAGSSSASSAADASADDPKRPAPSVTLPKGNSQTQYDFGIELLKRGQFDEAREAFKQFLKKNPKDDLAGNAQYWLGETYYVRGDYKNAADSFLKGYTTYSKSTKAPDSLLKLGMTLSQLGQKDAACATFGELKQRFPKASSSVVARNKQERQKAGCKG